MSLLFNMLSRLLIAFLPRTKGLLISWLQSPSAVILEPRKIKPLTLSIVSPTICHEVMELDAIILLFWMLSFKPTFSLSSVTFIKRLFSSLLSAIRVVSSPYLRLLIFLAILSLACASFSPAFLVTYSACKLNKQGDNIQPWCTPFPIWNQCVVSCPGLTIASWPAYRFLRRQVRWSGIPVSFRIFHSLLWSTQSKALVYSVKQMFFRRIGQSFYKYLLSALLSYEWVSKEMVAAMLNSTFRGVSELLPFKSSNLNKTALKVCVHWVVCCISGTEVSSLLTYEWVFHLQFYEVCTMIIPIL